MNVYATSCKHTEVHLSWSEPSAFNGMTTLKRIKSPEAIRLEVRSAETRHCLERAILTNRIGGYPSCRSCLDPTGQLWMDTSRRQ